MFLMTAIELYYLLILQLCLSGRFNNVHDICPPTPSSLILLPKSQPKPYNTTFFSRGAVGYVPLSPPGMIQFHI